MKGPIPIMFDMFKAVASKRPKRLSRCGPVSWLEDGWSDLVSISGISRDLTCEPCYFEELGLTPLPIEGEPGLSFALAIQVL